MNDRIFVVAGNHEQYKRWVRANVDKYYKQNQSVSLSNFVYVSGPEVMRGHNKVHGVFTGTYKDRDDIREIVRMIRMINNIDPGVQLLPDVFVGRGLQPKPTHTPIPDPSMPFPSQHVQIAFEGVLQQGGYTAVIKGQELTITFNQAPPLGAYIQAMAYHPKSGLHHHALFSGNGSTVVFTMKVY